MALPKSYRTPSVPAPLFGRRPSVSSGPSIGHHHHKNHQYNPFTQGQPGHPAFAAARFARLAESHDSGKIPVKPPKPPVQPYMRYSKKMWDHVKAANPRIKSIPDIGKMIMKMWQDLTDEERKEYEIEYELDKAAYQEALQNYHNSSAYQDWLKKEEMRKLQLAQEAEEKKSFSSRVGVVQADDEEDNVFSLKHLAAARYSRNHLLMSDIFSDTVVPDMRQVVFGSKLSKLRGQRSSLEETLGKRQADLKTAEEKHESVRKKIIEGRERWNVSWTEACAKKPKLTDEMFEQLLVKARQEVKEKMRQQQQQHSAGDQQSSSKATKPEGEAGSETSAQKVEEVSLPDAVKTEEEKPSASPGDTNKSSNSMETSVPTEHQENASPQEVHMENKDSEQSVEIKNDVADGGRDEEEGDEMIEENGDSKEEDVLPVDPSA